MDEVLDLYKAFCNETYAPDALTPDWVKNMILLEVYPKYYAGGFREITERLPFYREIGFNTLYLMPHWLGGYSPIDFYTVDPAYGTKANLKKLVDKAHRLGMKVFFDMVIHGFNERSPIIESNPELFVHDTLGNITRHRTWKSMSSDWASTHYLKYMSELASHHIQEYDIDGYRLDAASYKGPGWDKNTEHPAYKSGTNAVEVMKVMLQSLRSVKPDAMILNEVFGPVFYRVSNLAHDNQTEAPQQFLEKMERGEVTIQDYKKHMQRVFAMLPDNTNRVFFARNHDTSWFYHFNSYTSAFLNLDAVHTFCAIPEVFAGDHHRSKAPNPDDDPKVWDFYKKIFAIKEKIPELNTGKLLLKEVSCNNKNVFTAIRRSNDNAYLLLISFSDQPVEVNIALSPSLQLESQSIEFTDPVSGNVFRSKIGPEGLRLGPYQILIGKVS
ncbi:MAG: hypothetical protein F6K42_34080 [Leptolyngbya sp. SIO1D8]|nr:hypothetical protein [Leptolyngbya sp. SIO1D8]